VVLPPAGGAVLMSLSTIIVAINARLISYRKTRGDQDRPSTSPAETRMPDRRRSSQS